MCAFWRFVRHSRLRIFKQKSTQQEGRIIWQGKDTVVVLERFTLEEVVRYPSTTIAERELGIKAATIRRAIHGHLPVYDCYWVYEKELPTWTPRKTYFVRVNGNKVSPKLSELIKQKGL